MLIRFTNFYSMLCSWTITKSFLSFKSLIYWNCLVTFSYSKVLYFQLSVFVWFPNLCLFSFTSPGLYFGYFLDRFPKCAWTGFKWLSSRFKGVNNSWLSMIFGFNAFVLVRPGKVRRDCVSLGWIDPKPDQETRSRGLHSDIAGLFGGSNRHDYRTMFLFSGIC